MVKAICVWLDTIGNPGEPAWIVSRDELDEQGAAITTHTLRVFDVATDDDDEIDGEDSDAVYEEALEYARRKAAKLSLPVYANP